eukprot:g9269.t1
MDAAARAMHELRRVRRRDIKATNFLAHQTGPEEFVARVADLDHARRTKENRATLCEKKGTATPGLPLGHLSDHSGAAAQAQGHPAPFRATVTDLVGLFLLVMDEDAHKDKAVR